MPSLPRPFRGEKCVCGATFPPRPLGAQRPRHVLHPATSLTPRPIDKPGSAAGPWHSARAPAPKSTALAPARRLWQSAGVGGGAIGGGWAAARSAGVGGGAIGGGGRRRDRRGWAGRATAGRPNRIRRGAGGARRRRPGCGSGPRASRGSATRGRWRSSRP